MGIQHVVGQPEGWQAGGGGKDAQRGRDWKGSKLISLGFLLSRCATRKQLGWQQIHWSWKEFSHQKGKREIRAPLENELLVFAFPTWFSRVCDASHVNLLCRR